MANKTPTAHAIIVKRRDGIDIRIVGIHGYLHDCEGPATLIYDVVFNSRILGTLSFSTSTVSTPALVRVKPQRS